MGHKIYRVTAFRKLGDFTLQIWFDDGAEQVIDFEPALFGPVFEPLRDPKVFGQVELIEEVGCLEWPSGADFDPETLRNWPKYKDDIIARSDGVALLFARSRKDGYHFASVKSVYQFGQTQRVTTREWRTPPGSPDL